jgi:Asp-tRNA(Asn)/Glu-tRNA(Gln) amidotransferase A subunit family amidase
VEDLARLLDVIVGYDPEDPMTAHGVGFAPVSYTEFLDPDGLEGARIGILREAMGAGSEPDSEDFARVTEVFDVAVAELASPGAAVVDITIPGLAELVATRASDGAQEKALMTWLERGSNPPYQSREELTSQPAYAAAVAPPSSAAEARTRTTNTCSPARSS